MAVQYTDGSMSELMKFDDALTEFLQNEKAHSLHKFENVSEFKKFETKADIEKRLSDLEEKLEKATKDVIQSNVLFIPSQAEILEFK